MRLTQAQIQRVRTLEDENGRISAPTVVADAKMRSSPLHGLFKWNVRQAAERDWLHTAREIIASVTVQITRREMTIATPCYVHLPGQRSYQRIDAVRNDPEQARESLVYTLEVAAGHLRRAYDLAGPLGLAKQIDGILAEVAGVQRILTKNAA